MLETPCLQDNRIGGSPIWAMSKFTRKPILGALLIALSLLAAIVPSAPLVDAQEKSDLAVVTGRLVEEITDDFDFGPDPQPTRSSSTWSVVDAAGNATPVTTAAGFDAFELASLSGQSVSVDTARMSIEATGSLDQHARAGAPEHDMAVILIDAVGSGSRPFSRAQVADRVFNPNQTLNRYFDETSNGQVQFTGSVADVYGWFEPADLDFVASTCSGQLYTPWVTELVEEANISVGKYEHVLLLLNCDAGRGGVSTIGPRSTPVGGEICYCSSAYVAAPSAWWDILHPSMDPAVQAAGTSKMTLFEAVVGHELGHSLGGPHDALHTCGDKSWDVVANCDSGHFTHGNYDNYFSILGIGRGLSWTMSAAMRHHIGWIDETQLLVVEESGTYQVGPASPGPTARQAAAVTDPATGEIEYFIEVRTETGFGSDLALAPPGNEVQITTRRERAGLNPRRPQLLDGQPDQPGTQLDPSVGIIDPWDDNGVHAASLVGFLPGTGFTDEFGISITINSFNPNTQVATFTVQMPGDETTVPGDVNCDGQVSVVDAAITLQATVGLRIEADSCPLADPASELNTSAADLDNDDVVTIVDAAALMQCVVGAPSAVC